MNAVSVSYFASVLFFSVPLFATMIKIHNHIVTQKEKAEKRANSWKTAKKTNAVRTSTPKAQQQKDVYDISVDSTVCLTLDFL